MMLKPVIVAGMVAMVVMTATACGETPRGDGQSAAPADTATPVAADATRSSGEGKTRYPLVFDNCGKQYTFAKAPSRVVVMNGGSVAEVSSLLELGLGDRITVNAQSYGASDVAGRAEAIKVLPNGGIKLNEMQDIPRETMLSLRPDFVISTYDGGFAAKSGYATRDDLGKIGANTYAPASACGESGMVTGSPTVDSSYQMLRDFGQIFDVPGRAEQIIAASEQRIKDVTAKVAGKPAKNVMIVFPGMGADDFSSIAAAGIWNDVLGKAGVVNPFAADAKGAPFVTVGKDKLATASIDALIVVNYMNPDPEGSAKKILAQFPQWEATKSNRFLILSDSIYFGPSNDVAVDKIARMVHPDAF
ncbi:ABC transporter substrate-binding protein [Sphaerisporangium sp. NPDC051011]|uniref:ABC transporter substrate-binding protein n=1 Tax=Sphaerisporangium sp. NPDC051011 TaxID=3155792 RepID=UPI0033F8343B